jgi:hypothetical protein
MFLLNKTMPWMAAALLAAASAFGQDTCQPRQDKCPMKPEACPAPCNVKEMKAGMPAYNSPSGIQVCGWDHYGSVSFLYWQPSQDNMEIGLTDQLSVGALGAGFKGTFIQQEFDYHPGFKLGLGRDLNMDNWDLYAEYTYLHGATSVSPNNAPGGIYPSWGNPFIYLNQGAQLYTSAYSKWRCNLDLLDLELGRSYFVGTCLTFRPAIGLRAAWIQQSMHNQYVYSGAPASQGLVFTGNNGLAIFANNGTSDIYNRSHSWALGTRAGINTDWMVGQGLRFYGNGYADILYTKYKIQSKHVFTNASNGVTPGAFQFLISRSHVGVLRTHLDLELGTGWGMYLDDNNWHIDFSAGYGFQVFFDQNMFKRATTSNAPGIRASESGNLYIQGLTATARLDF